MAGSVTVTKSGATNAQILAALLADLANGIVADVRATPSQYPGTPYQNTGVLMNGLHVESTDPKSFSVMAPSGRLMEQRFAHGLRYLWSKLANERGLLWSRVLRR